MKRTVTQIIRELEKRAASFERRYNRTRSDFDQGAASNLRAVAIWSGSSKRPTKVKEAVENL